MTKLGIPIYVIITEKLTVFCHLFYVMNMVVVVVVVVEQTTGTNCFAEILDNNKKYTKLLSKGNKRVILVEEKFS